MWWLQALSTLAWVVSVGTTVVVLAVEALLRPCRGL